MLKSKIQTQTPFRSLTTVLTVYFLALSLIIVLIASSLGMYLNFQAQRKLIINQQDLIVQDAAGTVKNFIKEKFSILEIETKVNRMISSVDSQEQQRQVLGGLLTEPAFRQLVLLNKERQELMKVSRLSKFIPGCLTEQAKDELFSQVNQGEEYISSVCIDETTSEPMVIMAVPVKDVFGDFQGALAAEVNLKFMWDLVAGIKVGNEGVAYVVDKQGSLIAFKDTSRVLKGENLSHLKEVDEFINLDNVLPHSHKSDISKGINGTYVVSTHAPLGMPNWMVGVEFPVEEAYQSIVQLLGFSVLIVLLSFIIALLAGNFLSKRITKPIINLRDLALEISRGNLDKRIKIKSKDEIGQLANSFNSMAGELAKSIHKLKEEEARLIASINSLPLGFAIADVKGVFAITNPILLNLFSLNKKKLSFSDINERLPDKIGGKKFNLDIAREQVLHDRETIEIKKVPFENKFVRMFLSPIIFAYKGGEEVIGIVFLAEDITEQQRLDEAKTSFVAITAHELRTPLAVIRGNAELLLEMFPKKFEDPQAKTMVDAIQRNSIRLLSIVNDFLDLTFLEEHRIQLKNEKFDVVSVVNEIIEDFKPKADEKSLFLRFDLPAEPLPEIFADRERVKEIIVNVLSNAIQYTEKGGVTLSLAKNNAFIELSIKDTGIGIKESDQKLLFQKFQTVKGHFMRSKEYGSGMGLYISRLLAELMNADVKLKESTPGVGSTFVIDLPVSST